MITTPAQHQDQKLKKFSTANQKKPIIEESIMELKQIDLDSIDLNIKLRNPWEFLMKMALSVFLAETFVMLLFLVLPKIPDLVEAFLDSTLLSLLISPALYFFIYRPLIQEIREKSYIELELRRSQVSLKQQAENLKETLNQLQQFPQMIQTEKMSSLGQLMAGIAHEINNPVNFIHGNIGYVKEYVENLLSLIQLYQKHYPIPDLEIQTEIDTIELEFLEEDLVKLLNSMQMGTNRIRDLVRSLQNFSRTDESGFKLVNIHEGIDNTLVILQHRLRANYDHPTIQIIKSYGKIPKVECLSGELNQVFMNLIVNAIDVLEEQQKNVTVDLPHYLAPTITISTSVVDSDWVRIAIADNGPGMTEAMQKQIFNPFFTTKPVGKGTGMGLPISYQIITQKHRGKLTCFSTLGRGTELIIDLPRQQQSGNLIGVQY